MQAEGGGKQVKKKASPSCTLARLCTHESKAMSWGVCGSTVTVSKLTGVETVAVGFWLWYVGPTHCVVAADLGAMARDGGW